MRTLTIALNAASPRARLVLAEMSAGVGIWLSEPDTRLVRDQHVHTGSVGRHHAAELGEFLLACPAPDYEPEPCQDQATWLAYFVAGRPRPLADLDLRLNRGRVDARRGGPQGLLRSLPPAGSPLLLAALNVPLLRTGEDPTDHPTGAGTYLGHTHRLGGRLSRLRTSAA
ncbi:hypothetical protein GCM10010269_19740 [Streptomyces humidus]|uniref:Uncharacterized protein n=1 Tax=Streptomyces humidus TaxID=52259 RepID=A0A918FTJ1_9ACTN|nr:hypothetical protein [Streptomyces humidus]GGR80659.1 hypothetical protein GCM10010269_19740 [Streptomyces humidus]